MTRRRTKKDSPAAPRSAPIITINISTPAALLGIGALVVSGVGVADAATGGNFILGKSNAATKTSTLTNPNGTPLSLKAKTGTAPLLVNSNKMVKNLNANFLGGKAAAKFQKRVTGTCANGIKSILANGGATCSPADQLVFTANGSFTVPAGITHITGELWGGGGGGGYILGRGGSGAFESALITVAPGDVVHVAVGAAGTGVAFGNGTNGGDTTLSINSGSAIATAGGGPGGAYPCGPVGGGTAAVPTAPAFAMQTRDGVGGDCGSGGNPGFVGFGGQGYQSSGGAGVAIISLDN